MNNFHDGSVGQAQLPQTRVAANSGNTVYPTSYNGAYPKPPTGDDRFVVEWQLDTPESMSSATNFPPVEAAKIHPAESGESPRSGSRWWDELCQLEIRFSAVVFALIAAAAFSLLAAFATVFFP